MTPEQAAAKAAELLDEAKNNLLRPEYVEACVSVADAWRRLHDSLASVAAADAAHSWFNEDR